MKKKGPLARWGVFGSLAAPDYAHFRADFGDRPTLDMPEAALKERRKAVDQVDMEDKPSWCASIPSLPSAETMPWSALVLKQCTSGHEQAGGRHSVVSVAAQRRTRSSDAVRVLQARHLGSVPTI